jgi:hypothetical protein
MEHASEELYELTMAVAEGRMDKGTVVQELRRIAHARVARAEDS